MLICVILIKQEGIKMPINYVSSDAKANSDPYYIDLRYMQDDKRVLENPHKGWYYHYVDNGFSNINYRKGIESAETLPAKGINHIYIRFDWCDIEKSDGEFDWSEVDDIINRFGKNGYKFSLRFCTFESFRLEYAFPKFLNIPCTKCEKDGKTAFEPDYGSDEFFKYLERFMKAYGSHFDGNPLIEYIDIGTFGTWGEGHTSHGSGKKFGFDVLKRHIDMHLKYFPNTLVFVNDDMINHLFDTDKTGCSKLYDYCLNRNMGLRDDGACVHYYSEHFGFSTLRAPLFFEQFSKNNPVDVEMHHYNDVKTDDFGGGLRFIEALSEAKATYAGFHGDLDLWLKDNLHLHNHIANKLGYWYFIDGLTLPELVSGTSCFSEISIRNKGFSKAYHKFNLRIKLKGENGEYILNKENPDNRLWLGESKTAETVMLDLRSVPSGRYELLVGMFENETPIKLGFSREFERDGMYKISEVSVEELL